jgi:hypothetical protein
VTNPRSEGEGLHTTLPCRTSSALHRTVRYLKALRRAASG